MAVAFCVVCVSNPGERKEVHAALGQPEAERCGERLHVHKAHLWHFQYRVEVRDLSVFVCVCVFQMFGIDGNSVSFLKIKKCVPGNVVSTALQTGF